MPYADSDGNDSTVTRRLQEHDAALDTQAEAISANASQIDRIDHNIDYLFANLLESGADYKTTMRAFFIANGAAAMTDFSGLCDRWYRITRTGWTGGTRFYYSTTSMVSDGAKVGDNAGLTCVPSTNVSANKDDYASLPLFACVDCNWYLDASGKPHITAIDGICGNFERYNPAKFVGVLQMTGWYKRTEDEATDTYIHMYTDEIGADGYAPLPEAVDLDGTVRTWVCHGKYVAGNDLGCYSGCAPRDRDVSHNSSITLFRAAHGNQYGGKTSADDAFLKLMYYLKYGRMETDTVLTGCCSYSWQYAAAEVETAVERFVVTAAQAANILVGSTVIIGNPTAFTTPPTLNLGKNELGMRAKANRVKVTGKETLVSGNVAIIVDNKGVKFDTTANTITTAGDAPCYISSMPWHSGSCDDVLGNDGSPANPTSGKEPAMLQGIEYMVGGYEIVSDCILQYGKDAEDNNALGVLVCRDASKYSTSPNANYAKAGYQMRCPDARSWNTISEIGFDPERPEVWFPAKFGGTSSQRTRDSIYALAQSSGNYEWLSVGRLSYGVGAAGPSCVNAVSGLSLGLWNILARLSATGNRGEFVAA